MELIFNSFIVIDSVHYKTLPQFNHKFTFFIGFSICYYNFFVFHLANCCCFRSHSILLHNFCFFVLLWPVERPNVDLDRVHLISLSLFSMFHLQITVVVSIENHLLHILKNIKFKQHKMNELIFFRMKRDITQSNKCDE